MNSEEDSFDNQEPDAEASKGQRSGLRCSGLVGRLLIGARFTFRWTRFKEAVLWTTWDELWDAFKEMLLGLLFIPLLVVVPTWRLFAWAVAWLVWPFTRPEKSFYDMLERNTKD